MTAPTTTARYFANVGIDDTDGEPALLLYTPSADTANETITIKLEESAPLSALETQIRDAGFDLLDEWFIDSDGDLMREIRPVE